MQVRGRARRRPDQSVVRRRRQDGRRIEIRLQQGFDRGLVEALGEGQHHAALVHRGSRDSTPAKGGAVAALGWRRRGARPTAGQDARMPSGADLPQDRPLVAALAAR